MKEITLAELIESIQSSDDATRAAARDNAGTVGAEAVAPLAKFAASGDMEIARAANRAMQNIVFAAGRPGAETEAQAVSAELFKLLGDTQPLQFRRDVLWMIWQIADENAVEPVTPLLNHKELHEDARMALERLPGERATVALKAALKSADEANKPGLAHSLRKRGVEVPDIPDLRLVPTKNTAVRPALRPVGRKQ